MIKSRKYKSKLSFFNPFKLHRMNAKASCLEALILGSLILSSSQSAILFPDETSASLGTYVCLPVRGEGAFALLKLVWWLWGG